ncbi:MAG: hypothetical protein ACQESF_02460 [Nanobdellota archaeon]
MSYDFFVQTYLDSGVGGPAVAGGFMAALAGFLIIALFVGLVFYIYSSLAFMAIGKKAKDNLPGLAWIPGIGPALIAFRASGMHWWPWLLLIGFIIPVLNALASLAFTIVSVIWMWKMFEKINRPGWWAILMLIPLVNLVVMGIAAWSGKK